MVEELGRGGRARPVRPDGDRQRRARAAAGSATPPSACCPAWPTARRPARSRSAATSSVTRRRRLRRPPASCSAAGWPTCCSSPSATTSRSSTARGGGVDRRGAAEPRPAPGARRGSTLDGAPAEVAVRRRPDASSTSPARSSPPRPSASPASAPSQAAEYAKVREQFGRPIAMFQAVKHHCANMLVATELATAAVWDAARAAAGGGDQFSYTAAIAAALAVPAADLCANLNIQVHGGIGFTWEHDAHLYLRRATALECRRSTPTRRPRRRHRPARADGVRREPVRRPAARGRGDPRRGPRVRRQRRRPRRRGTHATALIETGYVHAALAEALGPRRRRRRAARHRAGVRAPPASSGPRYGITGWVILTLIQHATDDQVARWVPPGARPGGHLVPAVQRARRRLRRRRHQDQGAPGSTAAGWSTARRCGPAAPTSPATASPPCAPTPTCRSTTASPRWSSTCTPTGVEVRPLKMPTGDSEFNEVFFNDVFVPDDDVVGPVDGGWTVARATLGNESVSIGGGPGRHVAAGRDAHRAASTPTPSAWPAAPAASGATSPGHQAMAVLNLRTRPPRRRRRRARPRGQRHQAGAVRERPRGGGDPGRARPAPTPRSSTAPAHRRGMLRAHAPGHVDRRRHVGDQAQPDRRAHPRPAPRPAHQLTSTLIDRAHSSSRGDDPDGGRQGPRRRIRRGGRRNRRRWLAGPTRARRARGRRWRPWSVRVAWTRRLRPTDPAHRQ